MRHRVAILVLVVLSSLAGSTAFAQRFGRLGRPGRNPPGTWRYTGPGPGPWQAYPSYYPNYSSSYSSYPNYYSPTPSYSGPVYSSPTYPTPGVGWSSVPQSAVPPVAGNTVPVPSTTARATETFILTNPQSNGGSIRYTLNNFSYTMNPGESQTVPLDREWVITFDSGLNKTIQYRMQPGRYEFTVSPESGWNVMRRVPATAAIPAGPATPVAPTVPSEASPSDVNPALAEPIPL